jgi:hypothetical protein
MQIMFSLLAGPKPPQRDLKKERGAVQGSVVSCAQGGADPFGVRVVRARDDISRIAEDIKLLHTSLPFVGLENFGLAFPRSGRGCRGREKGVT